ncbi:branched-chain amino acid ABC transporter permease [Salinibacterium sp. SYSU T00001]|uniref:branched-chain amino acid ABC transporter permease n=1 Tax=Homoserinimonas sedimenticola TaxID=2986805 RepID=UPI002236380C|nr:branched-chain amino acid ABC transporter permease [Salinibacterium sedimenticola]MCW4385646.1 branched-chain amino acid ABC transporter permease [Salinibacterium sedimenticola]
MDAVVTLALSVFTLFGFYALLAVGMGLIFGQLGVVNVAHGELVMVGAFVMFALADVPFLPRLLLAVLIGLVLGVVIERLVLSNLYERGFLATLLAMWGVSIVLREGANAIFGSTPASVRAPIQENIEILGVSYPLYRLIIAVVALAIVAAVLLVTYRTKLGLVVRATVDNRDMASVLGIPPRLVVTGTFAVGAMLAVLAGALQSPLLGVTPMVGAAFLAPAFFAVLLGRAGSLPGAIFGAFVVALLSTVLRTYLNETLAQVVLFALLIVLVAVRPNGIDWRKVQWKPRTQPAQVAA